MKWWRLYFYPACTMLPTRTEAFKIHKIFYLYSATRWSCWTTEWVLRKDINKPRASFEISPRYIFNHSKNFFISKLTLDEGRWVLDTSKRISSEAQSYIQDQHIIKLNMKPLYKAGYTKWFSTEYSTLLVIDNIFSFVLASVLRGRTYFKPA